MQVGLTTILHCVLTYVAESTLTASLTSKHDRDVKIFDATAIIGPLPLGLAVCANGCPTVYVHHLLIACMTQC